MRLLFTLLAAFASFPAFSGEPDLSSPPAAVRSYLLATRANDIEAAKKCWVIDDDNASGALDVVVGMWVASRRLVAATEGRFGADGVKLLGRWNRPACTTKAIDLTLERLGTAEVQESTTYAKLTFAWQPGDGEAAPAFLHVKGPLILRPVGLHWKLDANLFTGSATASSLFEPGKVWPVWRDEMAVMADLTSGIEKGQFKDLGEFERELKMRVAALKEKYERKE